MLFQQRRLYPIMFTRVRNIFKYARPMFCRPVFTHPNFLRDFRFFANFIAFSIYFYRYMLWKLPKIRFFFKNSWKDSLKSSFIYIIIFLALRIFVAGKAFLNLLFVSKEWRRERDLRERMREREWERKKERGVSKKEWVSERSSNNKF